jgi:hypothetical protein
MIRVIYPLAGELLDLATDEVLAEVDRIGRAITERGLAAGVLQQPPPPEEWGGVRD